MRKTVALFIGVFLVFALGYATLHPSFLLLADWLCPVVGEPLLTVLTIVYLLFGDTLQFTALAALWAGVALLGGLIIRRRVGAVITMMLVFLLFLPALAVSAYGVFERLSEAGILMGGGNPFEALPPLPSGLTIATLFEAPIIGEALDAVIDLLMGSSPEGFGISVLMPILTPLIIDFAMKPVIIAVAAIVGAEVGMRLEPSFRPYSESLRVRLGGVPRFEPVDLAMMQGRIVLPMIMCIMLVTALAAVPPHAGSSEGVFYSENLLGVVDTEGRGVVAYLFVDSGISIGGVDADDPAAEGLVASLIVSHEGVAELLPDLVNVTGGLDIRSLVNMAPPTFMVSVYLGVPMEEAERRADTISSAFSSSYGVSLKKLVAFEPPSSEVEGTQMPQLAFVVYQSSADLEGMVEEHVQLFSAHGGLAETIEGAHISGRLMPGATQWSADGSALVTGFVNLQPVLEYLPADEGLPFLGGDTKVIGMFEELLSLFEGAVGFSGGVSVWEHGVRVTDDGYGFNLLELLGVEGGLGFAEESDFSLVVVAGLNQTADEGNFSLQNAKIFTSLSLDDPEMGEVFAPLSQMGVVTQVPPGGEVPASGLQMSISGVSMPLIVEVTKEASPLVAQPDGRIQVTVTVRNDDMNPMTSVSLDDGSTITGYPSSTRLVSGSTSEYWGEIGPGASRTLTYTIQLGDAGVYSLIPARVVYTHSGEEYSESSGRLEVTVARPGPVAFTMSSLATSWKRFASLLDIPTDGKGSTILMGSTLSVLAVLAVLEYRNFRKWISG